MSNAAQNLGAAAVQSYDITTSLRAISIGHGHTNDCRPYHTPPRVKSIRKQRAELLKKMMEVTKLDLAMNSLFARAKHLGYSLDCCVPMAWGGARMLVSCAWGYAWSTL